MRLIVVLVVVLAGCRDHRPPGLPLNVTPPTPLPSVSSSPTHSDGSAALVTVSPSTPRQPADDPPPAETSVLPDLNRELQRVSDVFFDYNRYSIRDDAAEVLRVNASVLAALFGHFPALHVVIEGHCDERGSAEYNLALGDLRAQAARDYLVSLGVKAEHLRIVSYGKERPQCAEETEACHQRNRRAHFGPR